MKRRGARLVGLAALVMMALACARGAPRQAEPSGRVVATIALPGVMVESLNPYAHSTTQIYPTWKHVLEPLVEWDWAKKDIVGVLAESWTTPDPNTWVFKLRQGVKFQDGGDFTAADVVHSYTRIQKDPDSKQGSGLAGIDEVQAVDTYTV